MLNKLLDLFRIKPVDQSLLAKKVDSMPQPAPAPVADTADVIKAAVTEQIAEAKPRNTRPRSPRKNTAKKKAP
jgi:hypothetical protein